MNEVKFNKFAICDTCGAESLCREVGNDDQCGGCYWGPINEAKHQAELSTLREELKTERLRADAAVGDANEAERSLTAAEQRSAELKNQLQQAVNLLSEARSLIPDFGGTKRFGVFRLNFTKFIECIGFARSDVPTKRALKPTESGASE